MRGPRLPALRSRNFRLLWVGLLISHTGTWMAVVGSPGAILGGAAIVATALLALGVPILWKGAERAAEA